jgi:FkbM family methyltransferase
MINVSKSKIVFTLLRILSFLFKKKKLFKSNKFSYVCNELTSNIIKLLMFFKLYEREEIKIVKYLDKNIDVIEAGGGIGLISLYIRCQIGNKPKHLILEPNKFNHKTIKKNFLLNKVSFTKTKIYPCALSDLDGKKVVYHIYESNFVNTISYTKSSNKFKKISQEIIETISINKLVKYNKIDKFQLVIDIEGGEFNVLAKNNEWLKKCNLIFFENHLSKIKLKKIFFILKKNNFDNIICSNNIYLFKKI